MKVQDLLQEETAFEAGKKLKREFLALGKELGVSIDYNIGLPRTNKNETWFGGNIIPAGGATAQSKIRIKLPPDVLAKGFLKELGKKLAELRASGRTITIGSGDTTSPSHVVQDGEDIGSLLISRAKHLYSRRMGSSTYRTGIDMGQNKFMSILWAVSHPPDISGDQILRLSAHLRFGDDGSKSEKFELYAPLPPKEAKALASRLAAFNQEHSVKMTDWRTGTVRPATRQFVTFIDTLVEIAKKHNVTIPGKPQLLDHRNRVSTTIGKFTKTSVPISPDEMREILSV